MPRRHNGLSRRHPLYLFTAGLAVGSLVSGLVAFGQESAKAAPTSTAAPQPSSFFEPDPTGDVTVYGDLEPLLGARDLYDAADLTGARAEVTGAAYRIEVGTVGAFTGASDVLFLTGDVTYAVQWRTVNRRGVVSELTEQLRLHVAADGQDIELNSLPPRCRNHPDFVAGVTEPSTSYAAVDAAAGLVLSIVVPRLCAKGTGTLPYGVADLRVTAEADGGGGSLLVGEYDDRAEAPGVAALPQR